MSLDPKSGTASLTTTWSEIVPADENRSSLVLQNLDGSSYVEIGGPDSTTGYRLAAGDEKTFYTDFRDESVKGAFWGKAQTGTVSLTWFAGRTERKPFGGHVGGPM